MRFPLTKSQYLLEITMKAKPYPPAHVPMSSLHARLIRVSMRKDTRKNHTSVRCARQPSPPAHWPKSQLHVRLIRVPDTKTPARPIPQYAVRGYISEIERENNNEKERKNCVWRICNLKAYVETPLPNVCGNPETHLLAVFWLELDQLKSERCRFGNYPIFHGPTPA